MVIIKKLEFLGYLNIVKKSKKGAKRFSFYDKNGRKSTNKKANAARV